MGKEQYLMQLSMMEQEAVKLQEQMQMIDQQILEMETLKQSIGEIENGKEKEMMANLGKNVFIKTEIKEKDLLVEVGNKVYVKKNAENTLKIVDNQIGQLRNAKNQVMNGLEEMQGEMQRLVEQAGNEEGK